MPIRRGAQALFLLSILVAASTFAAAQQGPLSTRIPVDPQITVGTLPNGLRYYIRKNAKPEQRAELRLVVNTGSLLEDDDQKGLAHFVEHMAFNGTKNFPKQALVDFLESIGMRFGADVNASTNFDETTFMLQVPTDKPDVLVIEGLLPWVTPVDVVQDVRRFAPRTFVVVLVEGPGAAEQMLAAGAHAVYSRAVPPADVADAVLRALGEAAGSNTPRVSA